MKLLTEEMRHRLVWGWLRLLLGTAQIVLAPFAILVLLTAGLGSTLTWVLIAATSLATLTSWLLYRGRPDPKLVDRGDPEKKVSDRVR